MQTSPNKHHSPVCEYIFSNIGYGNFIAPDIIVKINTIVGNNVIINSGSMFGHDVVINDFVVVSPGCVLTGYIKLEEGAFLGAGAIVIP